MKFFLHPQSDSIFKEMEVALETFILKAFATEMAIRPESGLIFDLKVALHLYVYNECSIVKVLIIPCSFTIYTQPHKSPFYLALSEISLLIYVLNTKC